MTTKRPPAVAGYFYPNDAEDLGKSVEAFLAAAEPATSPSATAPKALIVPHAGYVYSGAIAASAYVRIKAAADTIHQVVLLGPAHRVPVDGLAVSDADAFSTPLGDIPVDRAAIERLLRLPQVTLMEEAHAREHSLEVQLPFLQRILPKFRLVPLAVGDASTGEVREILDLLWDGPETLIVISSDLSHYHDYETARRLDRQTAQAIEELAADGLERWSACGRIGISGMLSAAAAHGLHAETIDLRSSGDTAGSREEVVGYGAFAFS